MGRVEDGASRQTICDERWCLTDLGRFGSKVSDVYLHSLFSTIGQSSLPLSPYPGRRQADVVGSTLVAAGTVVSTTLHFPALPSPTGFAEVVFGTRDEARSVPCPFLRHPLSR